MGIWGRSECVVNLLGGLVDDEGRRHRTASLRAMTGAEEEWLAANPQEPSATAVTRILASCVGQIGELKATIELVRDLLVGDRDFLMLQLRGLTLGEKVDAVLDCPGCGAKMDIDFRVADVPVEPRPQDTADFVLDLGGRPVRFRLPTGGDQEAVLGVATDEAVAMLLDRSLIDDGGRPLSPEERLEVIAAQERMAPQVELEFDLTCPECGHAFVMPFDMTAFFLREMCIGGDQLLCECHLLALHYHWNEPEILALRRNRRRAYLALLRDTLRGD